MIRHAALLAILAITSSVAADPLRPFLAMDRCQLDKLYLDAAPGPIPCGVTRGRVLYPPGCVLGRLKSQMIRPLWHGKVFLGNGCMVNRVLLGRAVWTKVYYGTSALDGRPTIIIDYSETSRLFCNVFDEMREVCPGIYLGTTFVRKPCGTERVMDFVIDARCPRSP
jgi:hypothetical protein